MDQTLINRIVEAALLASNQPLTLAQLRELFPEDQPAPNGAIEQALDALRETSADRGVELVEVASGFRFQIQADVHPWVARLWTERQTRYTRATLETLALIAYRQPITRGEIEQVRGVAVNSNIIKALEEREWIRVVGHRDVPGKPALFGTTKGFLDYFGLKRLDELPPLSELKDIGELEPQLQFDTGAPAIAAGVAQDAEPSRDGDGEPAQDGDEPQADESGVEGADEPAAEASRGIDEAGDVAGREDHISSAVTPPETGSATHEESAADDAADDTPEAAPGMRAADTNDHAQDNAVETTTVHTTEAASNEDAPEPQHHD